MKEEGEEESESGVAYSGVDESKEVDVGIRGEKLAVSERSSKNDELLTNENSVNNINAFFLPGLSIIISYQLFQRQLDVQSRSEDQLYKNMSI